MKKLIILLLSTLIISAVFTTALAQDTFEIDELFFTFMPPDQQEWITITDSDVDNVNAARYLHMQPGEISNILEDSGVYIMSFEKSFESIFAIAMMESEYTKELVSLNALSKRQLKLFAEGTLGNIPNYLFDEDSLAILGDTENMSCNVYEYEFIEHEQSQFIKLRAKIETELLDIPAVFYITIQNGQGIVAMVFSFLDDELSPELEAVSDGIIDSMHFNMLQKGSRPIDAYTIVMILLVLTIIAAVVCAIHSEMKKRKMKNEEFQYHTPELKEQLSTSTHSGTLD